MFMRVAVVAAILLLAASPSRGIVVQEGDYYPLLIATDDFTITGGRIDKLQLGSAETGGISNATFSGGVVGDTPFSVIEAMVQHVLVEGGTLNSSFFTRRGDYLFRGPYFRLWDLGRPENNSMFVQGWLADGSFLNTSVAQWDDTPAKFLSFRFEITPGTSPAGDADGDWDVDLRDLNLVRNHFGEDGYGVKELDAVRNDFGFGSGFDPAFERGLGPWIEITESTFIAPEPATVVLTAMTVLPLAAMCRRCQVRRSRHRPTPA